MGKVGRSILPISKSTAQGHLNPFVCSLFNFSIYFSSENKFSWYGTNLRQDTAEEFFLDFQYVNAKERGSSGDEAGYLLPAIDTLTNFTRRCQHNSWLVWTTGQLEQSFGQTPLRRMFQRNVELPELDVSKNEDGLATSSSPLITSMLLFSVIMLFLKLSVLRRIQVTSTMSSVHRFASLLQA